MLPEVVYVRDSFVWSPKITTFSVMDLFRVSYYTSVVGDDNRVSEVTRRIGETTFTCTGGGFKGTASLIPRVQKKRAASQKTKVVDVSITMDVMRAALTMPIDAIFLLTGDSDYRPLIAEIVRSTSKQVYLGAFSSGLADQLRTGMEIFLDLDPLFFA